MDREYELEIVRLSAARNDRRPNNEVTGKTPKLPQFADWTDQIDSYLQLLKHFARTNNRAFRLVVRSSFVFANNNCD